LASPYERPDQAAFARLDALVRKLMEELTALRGRTHRAEAELNEARSKGGSIAGPELLQVRQRIVDLERENQELRRRLANAREHMSAVSTRLVFLEDRNEKAG
jgi:chromosome segregation ATPase